MTHLFKNVHEYDGKLKNLFITKKTYTIKEKIEMFEKFKIKLNNIVSKSVLDMLIRDLNTKPSANFQVENNLDSTDILAHIIDHENSDDLLGCIEEQLSDISLGQCQSGRVTRLFQIWASLD